MNVNPTFPVLQAPAQDGVYHDYKRGAAKTIGILQIVLGILILVCQVAVYGMLSNSVYQMYAGSLGIAAPVLIFLAGAFGIQSSSTKSTCSVTATMVLSILSAVLCFGVLIEGAIFCFVISIAADEYDEYDYWSDEVYKSSQGGAELQDLQRSNTFYGLYGTMACLGVVEAVVAIVASGLCCQATCCGGTPGAVLSTNTMVHHPYHLHQPTVYPQLQDHKEKI